METMALSQVNGINKSKWWIFYKEIFETAMLIVKRNENMTRMMLSRVASAVKAKAPLNIKT
jgi:hypothetical protein